MQSHARVAVISFGLVLGMGVAGVLGGGHLPGHGRGESIGRFYSVVGAPVYAGEARQGKGKSKADPPPTLIPLPDGKGKDTVKRICSGCHSTNTVASQHYTREKWSSVMDAMTAKGMEATDDELAEMLDYVSLNFGPAKTEVAGAAGSAVRASELLVVNQGDASLSVVDPATNLQTAVLAEAVPSMVGHEVATSPDGQRAYLPLYGDAGVGRPGTDGRLMLVIDLASRKIVDRVDFGHGVRPHCILYERTKDLLYVTTELDKSVTIVDPHTLKIVGSVPTGQEQSHMLAISHDGKRGYTANVGPGTVSVLDLVGRKLVTTIPIAATTQRISVSNDDRMVFTSDQASPRMAVIDTATNTIRQWVDLPAPGYGSTSTKDGRLLLITLPTAESLAVVDLSTMKTVRTIKVGLKPQEVLVRPDGKTAYVSCFGGHEVKVIDLATWQVTSTIDVGQKADGMAWAGK